MNGEALVLERVTCPGCGLELPRVSRSFDHKFHVSSEYLGVAPRMRRLAARGD